MVCAPVEVDNLKVALNVITSSNSLKTKYYVITVSIIKGAALSLPEEAE